MHCTAIPGRTTCQDFSAHADLFGNCTTRTVDDQVWCIVHCQEGHRLRHVFGGSGIVALYGSNVNFSEIARLAPIVRIRMVNRIGDLESLLLIAKNGQEESLWVFEINVPAVELQKIPQAYPYALIASDILMSG